MECHRLISIGLCCVLLVSALNLVERTQAHAIQDGLPSLVLEDEPAQLAKEKVASQENERAALDAKKQPPVGEKVAASPIGQSEEPKIPEAKSGAPSGSPKQVESDNKVLISYETSGTPKVETESKPQEPLAAEPPAASLPPPSSQQPSADTQQSSASPASTSMIPDGGLKSLLESHSEAENDLAASAPKMIPDQQESSSDSVNKKTLDNNDHFHYSLGGAVSSSDEKTTASTTTTVATSSDPPRVSPVAGGSDSNSASAEEEEDDSDDSEHPLEGKKDEPSWSQADKPLEKGDSSTAAPTTTTTTAAPQSSLEGKAKPSEGEGVQVSSVTEAKPDQAPAQKPESKQELKPKIQPTDQEISPVDTKKEPAAVSSEKYDSENKASPSQAPASPTNKSPVPAAASESNKDKTSVSASSPDVPSIVAAPSEPSSKPESKIASKTGESSQGAVASPAEQANKKPEEERKGEPEKAAAPAAGESPAASNSTGVTAKSDRPAAKPVESIAGAAVAAAGSALGTAIADGLTGKTNTTKAPAFAPPQASSSTTSVRPTVRKSTTDKWNRWLPSSSTGAPSSSSSPPTRRRPILPSIRRRFRPYNRFSPFPWGNGPESYTPLGNDADSELGMESPSRPGSPSTSGSPTQTLRPRRRSTTESPSVKSTQSSLAPEDSDSEVPLASGRRRPLADGSKRRFHNRDRHHHNRENENRHHQADVSPDFSQPGWRRRHQNKHDQRPFYSSSSGGSFDPFQPLGPSFAPSSFGSSGFGLFNTPGSSPGSSGFDLLNPLSWIDEMTKPIRPLHSRPTGLRPGGQSPVGMEGELGEGGPQEDRPHVSHTYNHANRPPRRPQGGIGRDDYYDDYYNDHHCHDHDQDYRPPRRPARPPFNERPLPPPHGHDYDRPTYGGGGSYGYGRRPDRPPYRRDEDAPSASAQPTSGESEGTIIIRNENDNGESSSPPSSRRSVGGERPRPAASERASSAPESRSPASGGRISPASVFSPFDSLFGSIGDELFGSGLRSSFIETPLKTDSMRHTGTALDTVVSSPKILMPAENSGSNKPPSAIEKESLRL